MLRHHNSLVACQEIEGQKETRADPNDLVNLMARAVEGGERLWCLGNETLDQPPRAICRRPRGSVLVLLERPFIDPNVNRRPFARQP